MKYAVIDGTTVKSTGTIQQLFPNTSFTAAGPNTDFLTANNVVELVEMFFVMFVLAICCIIHPFTQIALERKLMVKM